LGVAGGVPDGVAAATVSSAAAPANRPSRTRAIKVTTALYAALAQASSRSNDPVRTGPSGR